MASAALAKSAGLSRALLKSDVATGLACNPQAHGGREAWEPRTPDMHFCVSGRSGSFPERDIQSIPNHFLARLPRPPTPPPPAWALAALSPV